MRHPAIAAAVLAMLAACTAAPPAPVLAPTPTAPFSVAPSSPAQTPSAVPTLVPSSPPIMVPSLAPSSPPPSVAPPPQLTPDSDRPLATFGENALVRGSHFAAGAWTLWIGPPRVGQPSCVPDDAVALETIQVGASGTFAHGFTMREDFGGGWKLLANGYARLYAAPDTARCGSPPVVTSLALPGYRAAIPWQLAASTCPASGGETSPSPLLTFFAPHAARVGQVVPMVLHVPIADSCYSACAGTATVDRATRTVRLGVTVFRQGGIGCLASGSEASTEVAFTPDAPGTWTIESDLTVGWPAGASQDHLTIEKIGDYQARGRWTMTVSP